MKAAITGGTGFIGTQIVQHLQSQGYEVILIGRNDITGETSLLKDKLKDVALVINLAGAPIVKRWTEDYKNNIYHSRIVTTTNLVYALDLKSTKLFISASAVGIYSGDRVQTENNFDYAGDYLALVCNDWEQEALQAKDTIRTVIFRFGMVLGNGGALHKMLPLFKLGIGGVIGNGKQAYSWVHIKDVIEAISFVNNHEECNGIYNLTSPYPVTNRIFTKTLAETLKRKAFFPIPVFVLKMIYGEGSIALINGQTVIPERLLNQGYKFQFPDLKEALEDIVGRR
jgi:uncharacterized protein